MGGVLSKGQKQAEEAAAAAVSTVQDAAQSLEDGKDTADGQEIAKAAVEANDLVEEGHSVKKVIVSEGEKQEILREAAEEASTSDAKPKSPLKLASKIPEDIAHILASGGHEDDPSLTSAIRSADAAIASSSSQSMNSAVADLKAKFGINSGPLQQGELESIRSEIEASTRESELKERLKRARLAKEQQALKGKGKERATEEDAEDSSDDSSDSDDSDSDSSSSSGSSLGLPARRVKRKRVAGANGAEEGLEDDDEEEEEDFDDDDDSFARPSKLLKGDGAALSAAAAALFASKNEIIEPVLESRHPERLSDDAKLQKLGLIDSIIDTVVVVRADITPDSMVLDEGSLIVLEDRTVLGPIFETFGAITSPMYSIRFPSTESSPLKHANTKIGGRVFFSPQPEHSEKLFSRDIRHLQSLKGSDASNLHDEEPGENEVEFSDDEQELEYKRMMKYEKKRRAMDRQGSYGYDLDDDEEGAIDDDEKPENAGLEDDEMVPSASHVEEYTPLTRPQTGGSPPVGSSSLPSAGGPNHSHPQRDHAGGEARGSGRGRGGKQDRGGRGKGSRGGKTDQRDGGRDRQQNGRDQRPGQPAGMGRGGDRGRGRGRGSERGGRGGRGGGFVSHQHRDHPADQPYPMQSPRHQRTPSGQMAHALPAKPAFAPSNAADLLPYDGPSISPVSSIQSAPPGSHAKAGPSLTPIAAGPSIEAYNPASPGPSAMSPPPQQQYPQVRQQSFPPASAPPQHQPAQHIPDRAPERSDAYNPMSNWQQARPMQQQQAQGYNPGFFGMPGMQQFGFPPFAQHQRVPQQPLPFQTQPQTYTPSPMAPPFIPQVSHTSTPFQQPNTPSRPHHQPHRNMTWRPPAPNTPESR